jgi:LysM repeat protein
VRRTRIARWVAPVAFLAVITIGALVVRAGLEQGKQHGRTQTTVSVTTKQRHGHKARQKRTYTIQSGDTLASIAAKTGTSVARLRQLNPGIDPTALQVGATIRVQ